MGDCPWICTCLPKWEYIGSWHTVPLASRPQHGLFIGHATRAMGCKSVLLRYSTRTSFVNNTRRSNVILTLPLAVNKSALRYDFQCFMCIRTFNFIGGSRKIDLSVSQSHCCCTVRTALRPAHFYVSLWLLSNRHPSPPVCLKCFCCRRALSSHPLAVLGPTGQKTPVWLTAVSTICSGTQC